MRLCLDRFLANEAQSAGRFKRGGGLQRVESSMNRRRMTFHREWERSVFASRSRRSGPSWIGSVRSFEAYDLADEPVRPTYRDLAAKFGLKETDVTNYLAAARRELRRALAERGYGVSV